MLVIGSFTEVQWQGSTSPSVLVWVMTRQEPRSYSGKHTLHDWLLLLSIIGYSTWATCPSCNAYQGSDIKFIRGKVLCWTRLWFPRASVVCFARIGVPVTVNVPETWEFSFLVTKYHANLGSFKVIVACYHIRHEQVGHNFRYTGRRSEPDGDIMLRSTYLEVCNRPCLVKMAFYGHDCTYWCLLGHLVRCPCRQIPVIKGRTLSTGTVVARPDSDVVHSNTIIRELLFQQYDYHDLWIHPPSMCPQWELGF